MYLKRLEVKGFKSFADKVELEFGTGITAVVGPNGSGKSNISDAIRWVLGEQSARTLRGSKMEDIIFAGTENRKALGVSEVSLIIDNTGGRIPFDYSEITVSRRLYRSGESEYLINGTSCRLKDIVELFMDTGIGKDGYSLIGQGRIDEILSSRSEDRRNLFEEAAGIVKYKTRKQEAERKLENTKQNLIRISDIIMQLEEQIEPLYEQSKVARRFLTLKEELKDLEINLILNNFEEANTKLEKIVKDISELNSSSVQMHKRKEEAQAELQMLKLDMDEIEKVFEELNSERLEVERSHENKQGSLRLLNERHDNFIRDRERIKNEKVREAERLDELNNRLEDILEKKRNTELDVDDHRARISSINLKYSEVNDSYVSLQKKIEDKKSDAIQILKTTAELNNRLNSSNIIDENFKNRRNQITRDIESRESKIRELNSEIEAIASFIDIQNKKYQDYRKLAEDGNIRYKKLEELEATLRKERDKSFEDLKTVEARYKALQDMDREMEGFNRAVKAIISKFRDGKRVYGTISDIIEVPRGFETAIEIALGPSIQNIVVDNEHTAGDMISYLKKGNLGRATFLPLTTVKSRDVAQNIESLGVSGYLGTAARIVKYDNRYFNAVSNLLGRILVCDNLENARTLAKRTDYNYRIVTLEGDVINSGGSFTGGSTNSKGSGVFSRKNEVVELGLSLEKIKLRIAELDNKLKENQEEGLRVRQASRDLEQKLQEITIVLNNEKNKIESREREKTSHIAYIKDMEVEIQQIENELRSNLKLVEEYRAKLSAVSEEQKEIERSIELMQKEFTSKAEEREAISLRLTDEKIVFAEKNKQLESILNNHTQLVTEKKELEKRISEYENQIVLLGQKILEVEEEIKEKISEIQKTAEGIVEIKDKVYNLDTSKKEKAATIALKEKETQGIDESIRDLTNSIHKLELSKSRIEGEIESLSNKLWEDYELTIPQAEKYKKEINSISESTRRVNELKNSIKALGDVNVNSIDEYKRVTERHEFLRGQEADLKQAEEALLEIIGDMTEKMKHQFEEKFKIIRHNFNETFKELFGGGYADLRLEEEDVLNSGIDIIVQPPGKKLQSLSLLSGGERGLAAIALIFAILKMKPTPFCVLDEIEAALDDANVNRFAEFLKEYSKNTQFIIITHRKGSMAVADSLYGVTMEEKGISKIVSLKLKGGN